MEIHNKIELEPYDLSNVDFKKVGVTNEQRLEYGLIHNTDPLTMAKLRRSAECDRFERKYGDLFQIEVDALQALEPEPFKDMVLNCVDELFDESIYEQNLDSTELKGNEIKPYIKRVHS